MLESYSWRGTDKYMNNVSTEWPLNGPLNYYKALKIAPQKDL